MHLGHVLENFLPAPPINFPVIIVLWSAANAQRTIDAAGTAKKSVVVRMGLCLPCLKTLQFDTFLYANLAGDDATGEKVRL